MNLVIREVDTDSLRHLMGVAIDEHVFLQDGQTVTLDLEGAAAEGCAVEVNSQDETFVAPGLGGGDVVAVEVAIERAWLLGLELELEFEQFDFLLLLHQGEFSF